MLTVEKTRKVTGISVGKIVAALDLNVGDTSDLPALGAVVENYKIASTSIACTKDGTFYKLHTDGNWYKQDGSGDSVTPSEG